MQPRDSTVPPESLLQAMQSRINELERLLGKAEQTLDVIRDGVVSAIVMGEQKDGYWIPAVKAVDRPYGVLIEHIRESAVALDERGTILYCNGKLAPLLGLPPGSLVGRTLSDFLDPDDRQSFEALLRSASFESKYCELTLLTANDARIAVYVSLGIVCEDRAAKVLCCIITDITQQKLKLAAVSHANAKVALEAIERERVAVELGRRSEWLRVTLESIGDGVITTNKDGCITWLNRMAETLTGWVSSDAVGKPLQHVLHIVHETRKADGERASAASPPGEPSTRATDNILLIARDQTEYGIEHRTAPIRSVDGQTLGTVVVFRDVTEQNRLTRELAHRAAHDALTGLLNRTEFDLLLARLVERTATDHSENALLYIDLDYFKIINDNCGHAVGDRLLREVAGLLGGAVRGSDTLARIGGDEFAVLLNRCPLAQAQRLAQRICDRLAEFRFKHGDRRFHVGASIGLVLIDRNWTNPTAIMQAADMSCYAAKQVGRNRVHLWSEDDPAMLTQQTEMRWVTRLEEAFDEDRLVLHVQRIVPLGKAGPGLHGEVLLRLRERDGSLIEPCAFLPAAERFHLACRIDRWVLQQVLERVAALPQPERLGLLCVNLSGQSLSDHGFHSWAGGMLREASPEVRSRLCLEITETSAVINLTDAARFVALARSLGVRVALDDFGAGASSFAYLKSMPVDFLKIDGQFVRDLMTDRLDQAAVRCFVDVAKSIGMRTVAEIVESEAVLHQLRAMGVDFAQGFLLHRPVPIAEFFQCRTDEDAHPAVRPHEAVH